jgi:hypothetical protein
VATIWLIDVVWVYADRTVGQRFEIAEPRLCRLILECRSYLRSMRVVGEATIDSAWQMLLFRTREY